jgi:hypothetical protein
MADREEKRENGRTAVDEANTMQLNSLSPKWRERRAMASTIGSLSAIVV